jgi:hypothetical protein
MALFLDRKEGIMVKKIIEKHKKRELSPKSPKVNNSRNIITQI